MTKRIRITGIPGSEERGSGIYGNPTPENPTGEYPVGYEFDTEADLPEGWKGRAEIVGKEPKKGSKLIANIDSDQLAAIRDEVVAEAQKHIDALKADHAVVLKAETDRADAAEKALAEMTAKLAAFDRDGDGNPGGANSGGVAATSDEIKSAVALLDGKNDDHWTDAGLPRVEAVAELTGKSVTRKAIEEAAPDAKRPAE